MSPGRIVSINLSDGGVPKLPVLEAHVGPNGLRGDRQRFEFHGGPERAVVIYSVELIDALRAEGHPISIGSTGENLTVSGLLWRAIVPGSELQAGAVRLKVTKYATPCRTIRESFLNGDVMRIGQKEHAGWSRVCAAVVTEGLIRIGDPLTVVFTPPQPLPFA